MKNYIKVALYVTFLHGFVAASGLYNPGSGSSGGGIVSPGTFTWVNNFGITVSTLSVTANGTTNPTPGVADVYKPAASSSDPLFSVGSNQQVNQFVVNDQQPLDLRRYGIRSGSLEVGDATSGTNQISSNQSGQQQINFWNSGEMDIKTATSGNGGKDIVLMPQQLELLRVSNSSGVIVSGVSNRYSLTVSTASASYILAVSTMGHINGNGASPTPSSCGTSPSMASGSNDWHGTINVGTGVVTSCVLTFFTPWAVNAPDCVVSDNGAAISSAVTARSVSSITIGTSATLGGGTISYHCFGSE